MQIAMVAVGHFAQLALSDRAVTAVIAIESGAIDSAEAMLGLFLSIVLVNVAASAHDGWVPLRQPQVLASPCAQRWRHMSAHFYGNASEAMHSDVRPLMFESNTSDFVVDLHVRVGRFESQYVSFNTRTYNGQIPAPTILVCPGDRLVFHVQNDLGVGGENVTNVHLHGMHVSPQGHADNVLQNIEPGDHREYVYNLRPDHPAGTFWYHPHTHGLVNAQLSGLMAGALIVMDRPDDLPTELAAMDDVVLELQALCIEKCHTNNDCIVNALQNDYVKRTTSAAAVAAAEAKGSLNQTTGWPMELRVDAASPLGDTSLLHMYVNGQYLPQLNTTVGEWKRFRYVNAIANNVAELIVPGCDVHVLSMDGIYWDAPMEREVVVLPPGGRADVAVRCTMPGVFYVETEASPKRNQLLGKINHHRVPSQRVLILHVMEEDDEESDKLQTVVKALDLPTSLPRRPEYMEDHMALSASDIPHSNIYDYAFSVWLDAAKPGLQFGVNRRGFDDAFVNHSMRVDEPQEWKLSVNSELTPCDETLPANVKLRGSSEQPGCRTMNHPFHMHGTHFQISLPDMGLDPDEVLFRRGEWRDTIPLFKSTIGIRFTPRSHMIGRILTHCHVASHADNGMGQLVQVLSAS
ncbi:TPA: hypothetical protein N0F65_007122 [Lagenidium giganteum]|uniref:Multicopper oxidase n=1 Tax=Lagenidium giganteum TaxID=4803 RepID=A0AAV2YNH5_9STRA|nr:TPA: hypothetical protein N0F65_007122 [Lagenidium giganteum]